MKRMTRPQTPLAHAHLALASWLALGLLIAGCQSAHITQHGGEASLRAKSIEQEPFIRHGTVKHKDGSVEQYVEQGGARVEHDEAADIGDEAHQIEPARFVLVVQAPYGDRDRGDDRRVRARSGGPCPSGR